MKTTTVKNSVLGGLWPVHGGETFTCTAAPGAKSPGIDDIFLVPQRIYMCIGTLAGPRWRTRTGYRRASAQKHRRPS